MPALYLQSFHFYHSNRVPSLESLVSTSGAPVVGCGAHPQQEAPSSHAIVVRGSAVPEIQQETLEQGHGCESHSQHPEGFSRQKAAEALGNGGVHGSLNGVVGGDWCGCFVKVVHKKSLVCCHIAVVPDCD